MRLLPSRGVVVLMYHSIGSNDAFFTVSAEEFEKQMRYLIEHKYQVLSIPEMLDLIEAKRTMPKKAVVITFDDGYEDNFSIAFPILKKYGFRAAVFLTTGTISGSRTTSGGVVIPMLNWHQIREMADSGLVEFYPHSDTHPKLDVVNEDALESEIQTSRNIVEKELNTKVTVFAYPYGRYNKLVMQKLRENGFRAAFTVEAGYVSSAVEPLAINRNSVDSRVTTAMFKGIVKRGRYK